MEHRSNYSVILTLVSSSVIPLQDLFLVNQFGPKSTLYCPPALKTSKMSDLQKCGHIMSIKCVREPYKTDHLVLLRHFYLHFVWPAPWLTQGFDLFTSAFLFSRLACALPGICFLDKSCECERWFMALPLTWRLERWRLGSPLVRVLFQGLWRDS